jgi:hypothetical protein
MVDAELLGSGTSLPVSILAGSTAAEMELRVSISVYVKHNGTDVQKMWKGSYLCYQNKKSKLREKSYLRIYVVLLLLVYPQYKVRLHRYKGQRYVDQYQGATTL